MNVNVRWVILALAVPSVLAAQTLPTWRLVPEFSVGSVDDSTTSFNQVTGGVLAPNGQLWFTQWNVAEIRAITASGGVGKRIGRRGSGPGEFTLAGALGFHDDLMWIIDPAARRVTSFRSDGALAGTERIRPVQFSGGVRSAPHALLKSGAILVLPQIDPTWPPAEGAPLPVVAVRADGTAVDTIARLSGAQVSVRIRLRSDRFVIHRRPLIDAPLIVPTLDGTVVLILDRTAAQSANAGTYRISRITERGDTVFTRTYSLMNARPGQRR